MKGIAQRPATHSTQTSVTRKMKTTGAFFFSYPWREPGGPRLVVDFTKRPKVLGRTKQHDKEDGRSTVMTAGVHLYEPVRWYLQQLTWSPPAANHYGTSNMQLSWTLSWPRGHPSIPPE